MTNFESIDLLSLEHVTGGGPEERLPSGLTRTEHSNAVIDGAIIGGAGGALTGAVWGGAFGFMAGGIGVIPGAIAGAAWGAGAGATVGTFGNLFLQQWRAPNR